MNLAEPQTFNEILQWLKLYRRTPGLNRLVDKLDVRRIVQEKVGLKHLNELYGEGVHIGPSPAPVEPGFVLYAPPRRRSSGSA